MQALFTVQSQCQGLTTLSRMPTTPVPRIHVPFLVQSGEVCLGSRTVSRRDSQARRSQTRDAPSGIGTGTDLVPA